MIDIRTDRSRIITHQTCPRKRYWGFEWDDIGLEIKGTLIYLLMGIAVHKLLERVPKGDWEAHISSVLAAFRGKVTIENPTDDYLMLVEEQCALVEALVRGFVALRWPRLDREYKVLEVEKEYTLDLGSGVKLMTRLDWLVERKSDQRLYIVNFKTTKEANHFWVKQWPYDMQTISEVLPVEAERGVKLGGVLIEGLVKGRKSVQYPREGGNWYHSNVLTWAWRKVGSPPLEEEMWAARYEWEEDGRKRRLEKGWQRVPAWRDYPGGIKAWVEWVLQYEPGAAEGCFVTIPPILRDEHEIEEWKQATVEQEIRIKEDCARVKFAGEPLAVLFPKHTANGNCVRPSECPYLDLCWGVSGDDPLGSGRFQRRVPNHPQEAQHDSTTG
ncbi:hypothetical protein LCGC14_0892070 [marine sediment metagenome]|uniref:PD-(D/E)XK endonuclease-like domain-containing protein n=1 Tax=marine sediment metagenome TaxID=412755 RepID=A0A0F9P3P8_9ZZZZ